MSPSEQYAPNSPDQVPFYPTRGDDSTQTVSVKVDELEIKGPNASLKLGKLLARGSEKQKETKTLLLVGSARQGRVGGRGGAVVS